MSSPTPRSDLRVVIVEDHVLFAESLELALSIEGYDVRRVPLPEDEVSPAALLRSITRLNPRVVLLDLDLGSFGDGGRLVTPLAKAGINVVVVTASNEQARWGEVIRLGARKVLSKSRPLNEILATVRRLNQGQRVMESEEREELLATWSRERAHLASARSRLESLTIRERQVLAYLMEGESVRDIAAIGCVSEATVRTQVKSILSKLEVSSQLAAVGLANRVAWKSPQLT